MSPPDPAASGETEVAPSKTPTQSQADPAVARGNSSFSAETQTACRGSQTESRAAEAACSRTQTVADATPTASSNTPTESRMDRTPASSDLGVRGEPPTVPRANAAVAHGGAAVSDPVLTVRNANGDGSRSKPTPSGETQTVAGATPTVSVIVLTFNSRTFIERCLVGVFAQDYPLREVIVVDNASSDGTPDFVRERFPRARVISSPDNPGYGAGNNLGAAVASGDVLAFLNPDAIPEPDWLSHLLPRMRQHNRQLATSKVVLLANPARLNSSGNVLHYLGLSFCRGLNAPASTFDRLEDVPGASGAAFAISRRLFERLGGFDPSFFMYHDDVDLSLRALLAGERCLYVPDAVASHDYDLSVPPIKWGWIEAQRYAVLLKTFHFRTFLVLAPALAAADLMSLVYLAFMGPAFFNAKLRSYRWLFDHAATIRRARCHAQSTRVLTDRQVLSSLADQLPYEQIATPIYAFLAHLLVDPWFQLYRRLSLAIIRW